MDYVIRKLGGTRAGSYVHFVVYHLSVPVAHFFSYDEARNYIVKMTFK